MQSFSRDLRKRLLLSVVATLGLLSTQNVSAQNIDFESLVFGSPLFGIDINADGRTDVRFSPPAGGGFNPAGPDPDGQVHVTGAVLETSAESDPDIRVDFLGGATDSVQLGFALLTGLNDPGQGLRLSIFNRFDELLVSSFQPGELFPLDEDGGFSDFPEGEVLASFDGVASYALLDASAFGGRFVIDNFSGTFNPAVIPEPSGSLSLACLGLLLLARRSR